MRDPEIRRQDPRQRLGPDQRRAQQRPKTPRITPSSLTRRRATCCRACSRWSWTRQPEPSTCSAIRRCTSPSTSIQRGGPRRSARGSATKQAFYDLMTRGRRRLPAAGTTSRATRRATSTIMRRADATPADPQRTFSDAGAHVGAVSDAHMVSWNLAYWGRDRTRGDRVPLETIVHKQTGANADLYGLRDRGVLKPGMRADVNVIDFERLDSPAPQHGLRPARGRKTLYPAPHRLRRHDQPRRVGARKRRADRRAARPTRPRPPRPDQKA